MAKSIVIAVLAIMLVIVGLWGLRLGFTRAEQFQYSAEKAAIKGSIQYSDAKVQAMMTDLAAYNAVLVEVVKADQAGNVVLAGSLRGQARALVNKMKTESTLLGTNRTPPEVLAVIGGIR